MDKNMKVRVFNRSHGGVSYKIDSLRIVRDWAQPGDHIDVTVGELDELQYIPGGSKLLKNYLLIKNQDVCEYLGIATDPEYYYDEKTIKELLTVGTDDQLKDCLEFAPNGVIELLKRIAVDLPLDSARKAKIIDGALGINIEAMIRNNELSKQPDEDGEGEEKQRRSTPLAVVPTKETEKTSTSKYDYKRVK